jgi:hypothetical protein
MKVNAVVWIMSPDDDEERLSTEQVLTFLEAFLTAKQIPFIEFEPKTATELHEIPQADRAARQRWHVPDHPLRYARR